MVGLTGCGSGDGDGDATLERAQARVTAAEKDVSEAQTAFTAASEEFCGASKTYIVAIDRYGDLLNATATTVGDVKDAGSDLTRPAAEATAGAQAAVAANQELFAAEQDLADAKADLEAVTTSSTPSPSASATTTPSAKPLAPAGSVDKITAAEAALATAQEGITDSTPLAQAAQQFNSAAVALELTWLQLFADTGCLTEQEAAAEEAVRAYTTTLQEALSAVGRYDGEIDGIYGPKTVAGVEELQKANGLTVTGAVDKATAAALEAELLSKGGAAAQQSLTTTASVQQTLKLAGFWDGPVDGKWTPELTEALEDFQRELGVEPTGSVDSATVKAFEKAIAEATAPDPTPSSSPSSAPSDAGSPSAPASSSTPSSM
jgi:peptidoglycan hydrolase-like protein with peptidoglycan-binding domain